MSAESSPWASWVDESCASVRAAGQWRAPRTFDARGTEGRLDQRSEPVVSFASNDYLGLSTHPEVIAAAHRALDRWGTGSGASPLVTGTRPVHGELAEELADWRRCERAIVFPTGYAANMAVLTAFGSRHTTVFSDELNHASIIDGCRLADADVTVYRHGDLAGLGRALHETTGRALIVTDTVFSMDGDTADLAGLVECSREHRALLVLDEAHAVLGPEPPPWADLDLVRVGTLSKTLGALGGFVAGPRRFVEHLVNRARPYIFSTTPTPPDAAAALAALRIARSDEGAHLRERLAHLVDRVASAVGLEGHASPIIPVILGGADEAVSASEQLLADGLWVPAIRPPTVPAGTSRLRVTVSAVHTDRQVDRLLEGLGRLTAGRAVGSDPAPTEAGRGAA